MCFERPLGSMVALGTDEGSLLGDEIAAKLARIFRWVELKWPDGKGWK